MPYYSNRYSDSESKLPKHIHTIKRALANGEVRLHYYHRFTRKKIEGEPGTPEFMKSYKAACIAEPALAPFKRICGRTQPEVDFDFGSEEYESQFVALELAPIDVARVVIGRANDKAAGGRAFSEALAEELTEILETVAPTGCLLFGHVEGANKSGLN